MNGSNDEENLPVNTVLTESIDPSRSEKLLANLNGHRLLSASELEELAELLRDDEKRPGLQQDTSLLALLKAQLKERSNFTKYGKADHRPAAEQLARCLANFCAYNRSGSVEMVKLKVVKWACKCLINTKGCCQGDLYFLSLILNLFVTFDDEDSSDSECSSSSDESVEESPEKLGKKRIRQPTQDSEVADLINFDFMKFVKDSKDLEMLVKASVKVFNRYGKVSKQKVDINLKNTAIETTCAILENLVLESVETAKLLVESEILHALIELFMDFSQQKSDCSYLFDCIKIIHCLCSMCHAQVALKMISGEAGLFKKLVMIAAFTSNQDFKKEITKLINLISTAPIEKWPLELEMLWYICDILLHQAVECGVPELEYISMTSAAQFMIEDRVNAHLLDRDWWFDENIFNGIFLQYTSSDDQQRQHVALTMLRNMSVNKSIRSSMVTKLIDNGGMENILDIFTRPAEPVDEGTVVLGQTVQEVVKYQATILLRNLTGSMSQDLLDQYFKSHDLLSYVIKFAQDTEVEAMKSESCRLLCQIVKKTGNYETKIPDILELISGVMLDSRHEILKKEGLDALVSMLHRNKEHLPESLKERLSF